ncbi:MAG: hypothetical protein DYG98_06920 [Haliscomenobacteraceae bacterium CHB4]|nr:hypothetical protein [Haliscomenobacteraceae bacterium CHB4]
MSNVLQSNVQQRSKVGRVAVLWEKTDKKREGIDEKQVHRVSKYSRWYRKHSPSTLVFTICKQTTVL